MIFPIGFLKEFDRIPIVNLGVIVVCVIAYCCRFSPHYDWEPYFIPYPRQLAPEILEQIPEEERAEIESQVARHAWSRQPWSLLTGALLHDGMVHLAGNMIFLFVFGSALNSDLGHVRYGLFLMAAAILSTAGHLAVHQVGVVGASGMICGVTGFVAAAYPRHEVRVFWFFVRAGIAEWPCLVVVGLWFGFDLLSFLLGSDDGVAYAAHLSGSLIGFALGLVALKVGWLESDGHDFLSWYLGVKPAKSTARSAAELEWKVRRQPMAEFRPRPAPDLEPLPIVGDDDDDETASAGRKRRRDSGDEATSLPAYRKLTAYFARRDAREPIPAADIATLTAWYDAYRTRHAGARIPPRALVSLARMFARLDDDERGFDAYRRLVAHATGAKIGQIALEAAQHALKRRQPRVARWFVQKARSATVPAGLHAELEWLEAHLADGA